jgi:hypothetical protein
MSSVQHLASDIHSCDLPYFPLHTHGSAAKSVSNISKQREQPQELWYHTGGLKRHFYFDVDRNNAQGGETPSYVRLPADTPQTILLSGETEKKIMVAICGEYTLLGAWNSKPYYRSDKGYHMFYKHTGWCIDKYLGYVHCRASISHFISC